MPNPSRTEVIGMFVDVTNLHGASEKILGWACQHQPRYVCVSNVHMCMEAFDSDHYRAVVNSADLVIADGRPISIAQQLLGDADAKQVRGMDLVNDLCRQAAEQRITLGFYGSTEDTLAAMVGVLRKRYSEIDIRYTFSPPFRDLSDKEKNEIRGAINDGNVAILFVGLGCPKQERWMADNKPYLHCVSIGVGAAFEFIAGSKAHAPRWMQRVALEWLFRLAQEPRRLWRRYLKHNPRFIYHLCRQLISHWTKS